MLRMLLSDIVHRNRTFGSPSNNLEILTSTYVVIDLFKVSFLAPFWLAVGPQSL